MPQDRMDYRVKRERPGLEAPIWQVRPGIGVLRDRLVGRDRREPSVLQVTWQSALPAKRVRPVRLAPKVLSEARALVARVWSALRVLSEPWVASAPKAPQGSLELKVMLESAPKGQLDRRGLPGSRVSAGIWVQRGQRWWVQAVPPVKSVPPVRRA